MSGYQQLLTIHQLFTMMVLLLGSGSVMAQTGDGDATNYGEVITNFLAQPVHLLWLVPLVFLFVSSVIARRKAAIEDNK